MKISEIKDPELRELALKRCDKGYGMESDLDKAFTWHDTAEEWDFWNDVDNGLTPLIPEPRQLTIEQAEKEFNIKILV